METLLSDSIIWLWGLDWSVNNDDLHKHFSQVAGPAGRAETPEGWNLAFQLDVLFADNFGHIS